MIKLCGSPISNYYNKVKLCLLEKGISFDEQLVRPGSRDEAVLQNSPAGKIPFLLTDHGPISESSAIVEYLEDAYPEHPLLPAEPFQRAKCRELILHLELNVELAARRLYAEAFFGGSVSEETKHQVRDALGIGLSAFARLAKFAPFAAGNSFSLADCACWPSLRVVSLATANVFGEDLLARVPGVADYMSFIANRPHAQKVAADRDVALRAFFGKQ